MAEEDRRDARFARWKRMDATISTFYCAGCRAGMQLIVESQREISVPGDPPARRLYGHCVRCWAPAIVDEEMESEHGESVWVNQRQLFPATDPSIPSIAFKAPRQVEVSLREARLTAAAGAWLATGVMIRRTLEAMARDFKPDAKTLFDGLKAMRAQGVISDELLEWGDHLRFIGNLSAHPTEESVTREDASDAMEFLDAILEIIYDLRPKFQAMKLRRPERAINRKPSGKS